jgi:hypothetical protein
VKVFIGHIHEEAPLAQFLKDAVIAAFPDYGNEVYVSSDGGLVGSDWIDNWSTALKDAPVVILLCSPTAARRPWICFEWGAGWLRATQNTCRLLVVCHSGQEKDKLPFGRIQALQATDESFATNLFAAIGSALHATPEAFDHGAFKTAFVATALRLKKESVPSPQPEVRKQYLPVTVERRGDALCMEVDVGAEVRHVSGRLPFEQWCEQVDKLQSFLADPRQQRVCGVGLAIGIQNALWGNHKLYPGLRMKGRIDEHQSGATVAQGAFNTGYQLLKCRQDLEGLQSGADLQDLFRLVGHRHRKAAIPKHGPVRESFMRQFGKKCFTLRLSDGAEELATVCLNKSLYFPRFEIGVWRYVDIGDTDINALGILPGFGGDEFAEEGSYWIWVDEDEVEFRSYGHTSHIPRREGWPVPQSAAKVLATRSYLTEQWGVTDIFLPWGSDEDVNAGNVIKEPFSAPARALME